MSYTCLKPRSGCVAVGLCNLTVKNIILKPNMIVAEITAANVVPHILVPKNSMGTKNEQATTHLSELCNTTEVGTCSDNLKQCSSPNDTLPYEKIALGSEKLVELFDKIHLSGIQDWEEEDQQEVLSLITKNGFLCALDDLDLGRISMVIHTIKLTNSTLLRRDTTDFHPLNTRKLKSTYMKCSK